MGEWNHAELGGGCQMPALYTSVAARGEGLLPFYPEVASISSAPKTTWRVRGT